jgi:hypothetical protein
MRDILGHEHREEVAVTEAFALGASLEFRIESAQDGEMQPSQHAVEIECHHCTPLKKREDVLSAVELSLVGREERSLERGRSIAEQRLVELLDLGLPREAMTMDDLGQERLGVDLAEVVL